jgi:single-strand DNA-binding protein
VEGRIEYRTWEDREGNTRYSTEINARELIPLGSKGGGGGGGGGTEAEAQTPARAAQAVAAESKSQSYEDFPEALDEEDDDLPF